MYEALIKAAARKPRPKGKTLSFGPWHGGLMTERQPEQGIKSECSELLNFVLFGGGTARTRPGTELVCSGVTGSIVAADDILVDSNYYTFLASDDNPSYRLYLRDGSSVIDIGRLEGQARLMGYMGFLVVADGGTLKYLSSADYTDWATLQSYSAGDQVVNASKGYRCTQDHTSSASNEPGVGGGWSNYWEQTWLNVVYDNGIGVSGNYQYNKRFEESKGNVPLGNGATERVAQRIETTTWSEDHLITPTIFYALLSKHGNGYSVSDDPVYFRIRKVVDDTIIASKKIIDHANDLPDSPREHSIVLNEEDISGALEQQSEYYVSMEFSGGDADNYVEVHYTNNDDAGGGCSSYASGAWTLDTSKDIVAALKPGPGPQLIDAIVAGAKLMGIEGENGDHPSYIWYCDDGNLFDWSSPDGGGYLEAMDKHASAFPVGAIAEFYGKVYLFGTPRQPFFATISGASPAAWRVTATLQRVSGHYKSTVVTPDDIYFRHRGGVDAISTIQAYGDLASVSQTDNIKDVLTRNFSSDDIAGYEPTLGLVLLKPADHDYTYAIHARLKSIRRRGLAQVPFSPVTRWEFAFSGTPSCFGHGDGRLYIGTTAGELHQMDDTLVQDNDIDLGYKLASYYPTTGFGELQAYKINQVLSGKFGGSFKINFHRNHSREVYDSITFELPWDTSTDPSEMTMDVEEALFQINPENTYYDRADVNFNFRALMISISDLVLNGSHIYFGPVTLSCYAIGGF